MEQISFKAPLDRIAALIGKAGETKKKIEKIGKVKITIDSESGDVEIDGSDPLKLLHAQHVTKAIARGFSPEKAFKLFEEDYLLDILELSDVTDSKKELENIRGRVIGTSGKAREKIEQEAGCFISVYGKTVSIIAKTHNLPKARKAVEMLLRGATHSNVYNTLKRIESKKFELD